MTNMIERVALKICEALGDWNPVPMNKMAYEDAARAALSAMPRHVPEGWVLVPKEPTPEMVSAMDHFSRTHTHTFAVYRLLYAAILASAPPAPLSEASDKPVNTQLEK